MGHIEVKLLGNLKYYTEGEKKVHRLELDENEEISLEKVIEELKLPRDEINLILVNEEACELSSKIKKGDRVKILPVIAGGI